MLTYHHCSIEKERALAERALELFLSSPGLVWKDAYAAAAYERAYGPERLQQLLTLVARGKTLANAHQLISPSDTRLPEASEL